MKTTEQRIAELIKRHAFLRYSNTKSHSRTLDEAIGRIEQEYIMFTGYEIKDNSEHQKLLEYYDNELNKEKNIHVK